MPFCGSDLTQTPNYCGFTPRSGGLGRFILIDCEDLASAPEFEADLQAWSQFATTSCVYISNKLFGGKTETSNDKIRTSICGPEKTVGRTRTYNFRDYNAYENNFDFNFYNQLQRYRHKYRIAFITCDERISEFQEFEIDSDVVIPDDAKNLMYHNVQVQSIGFDNIRYYKVEGIIRLLEENNCIQ